MEAFAESLQTIEVSEMNDLCLSGLDSFARTSDLTPLAWRRPMKRKRRLGLVTHLAAVDARWRTALSVMDDILPGEVVTIFGPEHGFIGHAQDLESVGPAASASATQTGTPRQWISLYGATAKSLKPTSAQLADIDELWIDLQDIGARYYTFQATMLYCLEAAAELGLPVVILDRPNPLGGHHVEGPALHPGFHSFVGCHDIAIRHGMTLAELALLYAAERDLPVELGLFTAQEWHRGLRWEQTGLPWVLPSPNMPTPDTALVYPGQCLLEGTNLSEGRGTTRPFELCGFPDIDAEALARTLNADQLPGVFFRPCGFKPGFQKWANHLCGGVQLHVTDPSTFRPVRTGAAVLIALRAAAGAAFAWRTETYEFVDHPIAIDLLFGSDRERLAIESGATWQDLAAAWEPEEEAFRQRRATHLIYTAGAE
jgi:uncharacterized protein YbbC (DUF1343 family)